MKIEKNLKFNTPLITEERISALIGTNKTIYDSGPILDDEDIIVRLVKELNTPEGQKMADETFKEMLDAGIV